jgi:(p)ppGpp synthase/HD superfamily hydrolase
VHLVIRFFPGKGALQEILRMCAGQGISVRQALISNEVRADRTEQSIRMTLRGDNDLSGLLKELETINGVSSVQREEGAG